MSEPLEGGEAFLPRPVPPLAAVGPTPSLPTDPEVAADPGPPHRIDELPERNGSAVDDDPPTMGPPGGDGDVDGARDAEDVVDRGDGAARDVDEIDETDEIDEIDEIDASAWAPRLGAVGPAWLGKFTRPPPGHGLSDYWNLARWRRAGPASGSRLAAPCRAPPCLLLFQHGHAKCMSMSMG